MVHVDLALILTFMPNDGFTLTEQPLVLPAQDAVDDESSSAEARRAAGQGHRR